MLKVKRDKIYYRNYYNKNKKRILENKRKRKYKSGVIQMKTPFKSVNWKWKYETLKESFLEVCALLKKSLNLQLYNIKAEIIIDFLMLIDGIVIGLTLSQLI